MLIAYPRTRQLGFTLVELLIGIVILGILSAVALPSFRVMLLNAQIRNAAESMQNGILLARAEAIRRGDTTVEFVLQPIAAKNQTSWIVQVPSEGNLLVEQRLSSEGSPGVTRVVTPAKATTITFDNTGSPRPTNADGSNRLEKIVLDLDASVLDSNQSQELEVTIDFGGKIRMCDPNVSSPNPRACN